MHVSQLPSPRRKTSFAIISYTATVPLAALSGVEPKSQPLKASFHNHADPSAPLAQAHQDSVRPGGREPPGHAAIRRRPRLTSAAVMPRGAGQAPPAASRERGGSKMRCCALPFPGAPRLLLHRSRNYREDHRQQWPGQPWGCLKRSSPGAHTRQAPLRMSEQRWNKASEEEKSENLQLEMTFKLVHVGTE